MIVRVVMRKMQQMRTSNGAFIFADDLLTELKHSDIARSRLAYFFCQKQVCHCYSA